MSQESTQPSMPALLDDDLPPMPTVKLQLSRSFSNYGDPDVMAVEEWLNFGGTQPADEVIQNGFLILYNQVYCMGFRGQPHWTPTFHFTDEQQERWKVMEAISGLKPIMTDYQQVHYEHSVSVAAYKEKMNQ